VNAGGLTGRAGTGLAPTGFQSVARRLALVAGSRATGGALEIIEAGRTRLLGAGDPVACVEVHDPRFWGALLSRGSVGLGSSYVVGWWDADDLTAFLRALFSRVRPLLVRLDRLGQVFEGLLDIPARLSAPDRADDRANVRAHYDVSNQFFELMLDETMTYSCGLFEYPEAHLREAQLAKIDRLCRKLDLRPGDRLVEIGAGWGSFALRAARHYGAVVTTTTISAAWRHHDEFLSACSSLLVGDGLAALQAIVIDDGSFARAKRHDDFIKRMIFPGGCLPSVASLTASLARASDLRIVDLEDIGSHYAETLHRWEENLAARETEIANLGVSTEFRRLWTLYLAYCEAAFLDRHISDVQLVLAKPSWRARLEMRGG
jgi:cyclopropane-fatty-acyl-phospholipid synthase